MGATVMSPRSSVSKIVADLEAHKPCFVIVIDHSGVKFFRYWGGQMSKVEERDFRINVSKWKKKDLGHIAHPGIKITRGSQRDVFQHRVDAQYARLWKETAQRARQICAKEGLATIFLVGPDRLIRLLKSAFPQQRQQRIMLIGKDLGYLSTPQLCRRLEEDISEGTARIEVL